MISVDKSFDKYLKNSPKPLIFNKLNGDSTFFSINKKCSKNARFILKTNALGRIMPRYFFLGSDCGLSKSF